MKTFCSILFLISANEVNSQEFGRILSKGGKLAKKTSKASKADLSMGFEEIGMEQELSVEYNYTGKSEKLGSKASKYDMSVPFHLLHTKSHKNIFDVDQDVAASTDALSLEYTPIASKSSKSAYNGEESAPVHTDLSIEFVPASKSHKTSKNSKTLKISDEEKESITDTPESKSSKSTLPIAPRSITVGDESTVSDESDSKVTESNKESGASAQQVSAVSVAAIGAMLFL